MNLGFGQARRDGLEPALLPSRHLVKGIVMSTATIITKTTSSPGAQASVSSTGICRELNASAIGVATQDGVVTLTGFIDSYAGKLAAERVVKRVRGVRAVANDIKVRLLVEPNRH